MAQLHYGDQEARRQAADVDHDDAMKFQGEGYGVQAHHGRNDPFTADKESPADVSAAGYGDLEAKQKDGRKASPRSGYGNLEAKQEDAVEALPTSGYGGQPNRITMPKDEGYTSLGFEESQDDNNSENSLGVPSEEGINMKNREGSPHDESMAYKEFEDHSATGGGIIDVNSLKKDFVDLSERNTDQSAREREGRAPQGSYTDEKVERGGVQPLKEDYVDLPEGNTNKLKVDDPIKASHADTSQFTSQIKSPLDDPKQRYSADDPKQEFPIDDSSKQKDPIDTTKQESAVDDAKQELATTSPNDDDTHGCESSQADDGKEKIKAEGYNIYSSEPKKMVYDAAEMLGDQKYDKLTQKNDPEAAIIKPHEDLSAAQEESSPEAIKYVPEQVSGFDIMKSEQVSVSENEQARDYDDHKEPFTEHVSSPVEQDAGSKLDPKDREEYASERVESAAENVSANEESPYTEFNHTNDYVKVGYGAEGFVPKRNEDVDRELREPTERVYQEEQRRPTDENPLVRQEGNGERASSEDAYGTKEGNVKGIAHGKEDDDNINNKEIDNIVVPMRPPSLPHPGPEDLAEEAFNNKNDSNVDDGQQNHEGPHKKGVFEKIKDKLSPHFTSN